MVKKVEGKADYLHNALAMIEHVGRLVAADPSNDCELTAGGKIGTAIIRELMSEGFLPWITKDGQIYHLTARLAGCCCEQDCYNRTSSNQIGGDGSQCQACYLDQRDGKDRVRRGMLSTFSPVQKVCVWKACKANMYGTWKLILDAGGDILKGKTTLQVRYCAKWLVKHGWYELQEGDLERGLKWDRAYASQTLAKTNKK